MVATGTIVIDNGANELKIGYSGEEEPKYRVPNCTAKPKGHLVQTLAADQVESIRDAAKATFFRPFDRGYVINWKCQDLIWSRVFGPEMMNVTPNDSKLLVTAPMMNPTKLQNDMDQMIFEQYGFEAYCRVVSPEMCLSPVKSASSCHVVIDSGFSFTHIAPMYKRKPVLNGIRRLNVGGKLLTNYLKEIVSYRQWNMMEETVLMNDVKESLCFCSLDFKRDMQQTSRPFHSIQTKRQCSIRKDWVLPDFQTTMKGHVKTYDEQENVALAGEQILTMGVERFTVPEVLFHPTDIGLDQGGLAQGVVEAVKACPPELHGLMYQNILLTGGTTKFPNFKERLYVCRVYKLDPKANIMNRAIDLRPLVPIEYDIGIEQLKDPILATWQGASAFATGPECQKRSVTRQEYMEHGSDLCRERFKC